MPFLITAHSTKPGEEDFYEKFLQDRKLAFVRDLPEVKNYTVFRTRRRADDPVEGKPNTIKYDIIAIVEVEDIEAVKKMRMSKLYQDFASEYRGLLEEDPAIYIADEVPEMAQKSKSEFWDSVS